MWVLTREIGLNDDQRLELASYLLRRDILTWTHLDEAQIGRMLDALEGAILVAELLRQRIDLEDDHPLAPLRHIRLSLLDDSE